MTSISKSRRVVFSAISILLVGLIAFVCAFPMWPKAFAGIEVDLIYDLGLWRQATGFDEQPTETIDLNGFPLTPGEVRTEKSLEGNGMPDAAELYLLESVLGDDGLDLSPGGISNAGAIAAWSTNLVAIEDFFEQASMPIPDGVDTTLAAYTTLGDAGSFCAADYSVRIGLDLPELNANTFSLAAAPYLAWKGDADGDGYTNYIEWRATSGEGDFANRKEAYVQSALDPDSTPFQGMDIEGWLSEFMAILEDPRSLEEFDTTLVDEYPGIPDLAEWKMLEAVLLTPAMDFSSTGGLNSMAVAERVYDVMDALMSELMNWEVPPEWPEVLTTALVIYDSMSDPLSRYLVYILKSMVELPTEQNPIDWCDFAYWMSPQGDADGDGFSNLLEWQWQLGVHNGDAALAIPDYVSVALNPGQFPSGTFYTMTRLTVGLGPLPYPIKEKYLAGTEVTLDAEEYGDQPPSGFVFDHWEGALSGTSKTANIVMDNDKEVTVVFAVPAEFEVCFADEHLEYAVRTALSKYTGALTAGEVRNLTGLNADASGISDLSGIEYCIGLTDLSLANNQIESITRLWSLGRLTQLNLRGNKISSILPLSSLHKLAGLSLYDNKIQDVWPLSRLTDLEALDLGANRIGDLRPLAGLAGLTELELGNNTPLSHAGEPAFGSNRITDISPLAGHSGLTYLGLRGTGISNGMLSVIAGLTSLESLDLGQNSLTDISALSSCQQLQIFAVDGNAALSNISVASNLGSLAIFAAADCAVSDLSPLSSLTHLAYIGCRNNQIISLAPLTGSNIHDAAIDLLNNPINDPDLCSIVQTIRDHGNLLLFKSPGVSCGYVLTTQVSGEGGIDPAIGVADLPAGMPVELFAIATAAPEWNFREWEVTGNTEAVSANPVTFVMDSDKTATAVFEEADVFLDVEVAGVGDVSPAPGVHGYADGAVVHACATAVPGWVFAGWEGDLEGTLSCGDVTMNSDKSIRAIFIPADWTLTVSMEGEGVILPSAGVYTYLDGEEVSLSAWASSGWAFAGWDMGSTIEPNCCPTIVMDRDREVKAVFLPLDKHLEVTVVGNGTVTPGSSEHFTNERIHFVCQAASGWMLDSWGGDLSGANPKPWLTMDTSKSVTATFVQVPHTAFTIGDTVLDNAVHDAIGKARGTQLYMDDVTGTGFTELAVNGAGFVSDFTGIEYCRDLLFIGLNGGNAVDDFSPLSQILGLETLHLWNTRPESLAPLAVLTNLQTLNLASCEIEDISPLASLTEMFYLDLHDNAISSVNALAGMHRLYYLDLGQNQLPDITPLESVHSIYHLDLRQNGITNLSAVSGMQDLYYLDASDNYIEDFYVKKCRIVFNGDPNYTIDYYSNWLELPDNGEIRFDGNRWPREGETLPAITSVTVELDARNAHNTPDKTFKVTLTSPENTMVEFDTGVSGPKTDLIEVELTDEAGAFTGEQICPGSSQWQLSIQDLPLLTPLINLRNLRVVKLSNNDITNLTPLMRYFGAKENEEHSLSIDGNYCLDLKSAFTHVPELTRRGVEIKHFIPRTPPTEGVRQEEYPKLLRQFDVPQPLWDTATHEKMCAQFNLVITPFDLMGPGGNNPTNKGIRAINPKTEIHSWTPFGGGTPKGSHWEPVTPPLGPNDWFLRNFDGTYAYPWEGSLELEANHARMHYTYAETFAQYVCDYLLNPADPDNRYDGVHFDCLFEFPNSYDYDEDGVNYMYGQTSPLPSDAAIYQKADDLAIRLVHNRFPNAPVTGNGFGPWTATCTHYRYANGNMHEAALFDYNNSTEADLWNGYWNGIRYCLDAPASPPDMPRYHLLIGCIQQQHGRLNQARMARLTQFDEFLLRRMRLALVTSMLDDGVYFCFDKRYEKIMPPYWFDEYEAKIGQPIMPDPPNGSRPYSQNKYASSTYSREFEDGVVIANVSDQQAVVSLAHTATDLTTKQTGTQFTIPAWDGRIFEYIQEEEGEGEGAVEGEGAIEGEGEGVVEGEGEGVAEGEGENEPDCNNGSCPGSVIVNSADVPKNIPNNDVVTSTLAVNTAITVDTVSVTLDIAHLYDSDLTVTLTSPSNTSITLFSDVVGKDFVGTVLSDAASIPLNAGLGPFTGWYRPAESLSAFQNEQAQGTWTLTITDNVMHDAGTLYRWGLQFGRDNCRGKSLDLVRDLESFMFIAGKRAPIDTPAFNINGNIVSANNVTTIEDFGGNDIPDAAEFSMLEAVLENRCLILPGGLDYATACTAWTDNLSAIEAAIGAKYVLPEVQRTLAAYSTLGDEASVSVAVAAASLLLEVDLSAIAFNKALAPYLSTWSNPDSDFNNNSVEWSALAKSNNIRTDGARYAQAALDSTRYAFYNLDFWAAMQSLIDLRGMTNTVTAATADWNTEQYPNGMPDIVEFFLVEQVLTNPGIHIAESGLTNELVRGRWNAVRTALETALKRFAMDQEPYRTLLNILPAYGVLSDADSEAFMHDMVLQYAAPDVVPLLNNVLLGDSYYLMSAQGDADGDGFSNLVEWQATDVPGASFAQRCSAYLSAALDPQQVPTGTFYTLRAVVSGHGTLHRPAQERFLSGTSLTLTAEASDAWEFLEWQGDLSGSTNPNTFTLQSDMSVIAVFQPSNLQTEITVPDAGLREALETAGATEPFTAGELAGLTVLNASDRNISNLTGIEYCTGLTQLSLNGNDLVDLSPLRGLLNLESLELNENEIFSLSAIANLRNLTVFKARRNHVSILTPLVGMETLQEVDLAENEIVNVAVASSWPQLEELTLFGNQIREIDGIAVNTSLGSGDSVYLHENYFFDDAMLEDVTDLVSRGCYVTADRTKLSVSAQPNPQNVQVGDNQWGHGFNGLSSVFPPDYPTVDFGGTMANHQHVFNGVVADAWRSIDTPRQDRCYVIPTNDVSAILRWPSEDSSWKIDSSMEFTVSSGKYIDLEFTATPREVCWGQGYVGFQWASYTAHARDWRIHFLGKENGGDEEWITFGDIYNGYGESGSIAFDGEPDLPYESGANGALIDVWSYKKFTKPFYYGLMDGDGDSQTSSDTMVFIVMFNCAAPIRLIMQNGGASGTAQPLVSCAWDWQYIMKNPVVDTAYGYKARIVFKPFVDADDVLQEYNSWPEK